MRLWPGHTWRQDTDMENMQSVSSLQGVLGHWRSSAQIFPHLFMPGLSRLCLISGYIDTHLPQRFPEEDRHCCTGPWAVVTSEILSSGERESPNGCDALIHGNCRDSWPDKAPNKAPICSHHCPPLRHNLASMAHGFLGNRSETHVQYELAAVSSLDISGHFPE